LQKGGRKGGGLGNRFRDYLCLPIKRPASAVLIETNLPCSSRVGPNFWLVRPMLCWSSPQTGVPNEPVYPVVAEPMTFLLPSRNHFLSSDIYSSLLLLCGDDSISASPACLG